MIEIDTSELTQALRLYQQATNKDWPDILNRAGRNIVLRAIPATPKADRAKMEAELRTPVSTTIFGKSGRRLKNAKTNYAATTLATRLAMAGLRAQGVDTRAMSTGEIEKAVRTFINRRLSSIGFLRSGYLPAARKFKASARGGDARQYGQDKGSGTLATEAVLVAEVVNTVEAITQIGKPALERAVAEVAVDMREYAEKKMAETAARYSARG